MDLRLKKYLDKYEIKYEEFKHPAVFTVEESKMLKSKISGMHCKCLFLRDELSNFYLVGMQADKRLDIKKIERHLVIRKLRFGNENELFDKLKIKPGSVSIFGLVNNSDRDVKLIIDKEVWKADKVGFHPNINTSTLVLNHEDLKKYYDSLGCEKEVLEL